MGEGDDALVEDKRRPDPQAGPQHGMVLNATVLSVCFVWDLVKVLGLLLL